MLHSLHNVQSRAPREQQVLGKGSLTGNQTTQMIVILCIRCSRPNAREELGKWENKYGIQSSLYSSAKSVLIHSVFSQFHLYATIGQIDVQRTVFTETSTQ